MGFKLLLFVIAGIIFSTGFFAGKLSSGKNDDIIEKTVEKSSDRTSKSSLGMSDFQLESLKDEPVKIQEPNLEDILTNPSRLDREQSLEKLGAKLFSRDLNSALEAADKIYDLTDQAAFLKGLAAQWAISDPLAAASHFSDRSFASKCELLPVVLSKWANANPQAAEAWVVKLAPGEARNRAVEAVYRNWAVIDPVAAGARSLEIKDPDARVRAVSSVIEEWSANDLVLTSNWIDTIQDNALKGIARVAVAEEMSKRSPQEAFRWASKVQEGNIQSDPSVVSTVAAEAGFRAPQEALDWLVNSPLAAQNLDSIAGIASYLAESDPQGAVQNFQNVPKQFQPVVAPSVASVIGMSSPENGPQWLAQIDDLEVRAAATSSYVSSWARQDRESALKWVNQLPSGIERDQAETILNQQPVDP